MGRCTWWISLCREVLGAECPSPSNRFAVQSTVELMRLDRRNVRGALIMAIIGDDRSDELYEVTGEQASRTGARSALLKEKRII
jgi:hypothetical protein